MYELAPPRTQAGGVWAEAILHVFTGFNDGRAPSGSLAIGATGALYGTAFWGGYGEPSCARGCGTLFALSPATGSKWTLSVLHRFTAQNGDGANPQSTLVPGAGQMLYGTTDYGGTAGFGTVFQLQP